MKVLMFSELLITTDQRDLHINPCDQHDTLSQFGPFGLLLRA